MNYTLGKQSIGKWQFLFLEIFQLITKDEMIEFTYYYFATLMN